jgi:hypothetical protein
MTVTCNAEPGRAQFQCIVLGVVLRRSQAIDIVSVAILVIMMLILGIPSQWGFANEPQLRVLRALGFSRWHLGGLVS